MHNYRGYVGHTYKTMETDARDASSLALYPQDAVGQSSRKVCKTTEKPG